MKQFNPCSYLVSLVLILTTPSPPSTCISLAGMNPPFSNTDTDLEQFRRFIPGGSLRRIPNVDSLSNEEVRTMFNIPKSVKITNMKSITDPVHKDEVVANLYQLACGLPMPIDPFTCALLNA
ncbi:hypothetical protein MKX01_038089 [Papaver californicum]|nr:hypothetical protein MKX01_038089 [Papaver californicum]